MNEMTAGEKVKVFAAMAASDLIPQFGPGDLGSGLVVQLAEEALADFAETASLETMAKIDASLKLTWRSG